MMRKRYVFLFSIITLLFYSCVGPVDGEIRNYSPFIFNYLLKANHFLLFVIFLLDSGKENWLNLYSRLYYFYFTLARVKCLLQQKKLLTNSHTEVWSLSNVKPRKIFGEEFKKIRTVCDYGIIESEQRFVKNTNTVIINNHKEIFIKQINDIKDYYTKNLGASDNAEIDNLLFEITGNYEMFLSKLKEAHENLEKM